MRVCVFTPLKMDILVKCDRNEHLKWKKTQPHFVIVVVNRKLASRYKHFTQCLYVSMSLSAGNGPQLADHTFSITG